jgi:hypothetical protein
MQQCFVRMLGRATVACRHELLLDLGLLMTVLVPVVRGWG